MSYFFCRIFIWAFILSGCSWSVVYLNMFTPASTYHRAFISFLTWLIINLPKDLINHQHGRSLLLRLSLFLFFCPFFLFLQLYVPDEDKSIFGRSVNKQIFEGLTTGLLQTIATILGCLWPHMSESGQGENMWISSPDAKVKSSATETFNTRAQDLIRYFCYSALYYFHTASPPLTWHLFFPLIS